VSVRRSCSSICELCRVKQRADSSTFSGINVTPLTDVMLVLLITFLLSASSFEQSSVTVPLPRVTQTQDVEKYACVIQIDAQGHVEWPEDGLSGLDRFQAMERLLELRNERILAVGVHRECPYGLLFPVLESAAEAGWEEVVVLTAEAP
jgi:biopolymer transport protein TolR